MGRTDRAHRHRSTSGVASSRYDYAGGSRMGNSGIDRRTFIQQGTAALAVGAIVASNAQAQDAPSAKRLRVAVIGCGSVSTKYLPYLVDTEHVEVVAVCDRKFD